MKIKKVTLFFFSAIVAFSSCSKKDNNPIITVEPRDRAEQQIVDRDSLLGYLETHYYNSGTFQNNLNRSIDDLVISKLPEDGILPDPSNNTLLIDAIEIKNTVYLNVDYEYYILRLNQGGGDSPNFTDNIRVKYTGNLLSGEVFDSSVSPIDFDLVSLVSGWNRVMPEFNSAESFIENGDGTIDFINPGVGVMFLPSGLAYFSGSVGGIPAFSLLIFRFEFYQTEVNDHDSDGIPSFLEDIDQDIDVSNDDTDGDFNVNFLDNDDDGDGVLTFNELEPFEYIVDTNIGETEPILDQKEFEISRSQNAGVITIQTVKIADSNGDGLDDYLDENITINYNEGN